MLLESKMIQCSNAKSRDFLSEQYDLAPKRFSFTSTCILYRLSAYMN
jgi:hypothetical protein